MLGTSGACYKLFFRRCLAVPCPRAPLTLLQLVDLPENLPRKGARKWSECEVIARKQKRRRNPVTSPEDKVFLYLYFLSTPLTWTKLGSLFGISATQASTVFYHVQQHLLPVLYDGPDATVVWPTPEEGAEAAQKLVGLPGCIGYIDGNLPLPTLQP